MNFRDHFPFFANQPNLIYADSAATSQKTSGVIKVMSEFIANDYATVHRSGYQLATAATSQFERARSQVARLVNCNRDSVVFTKGATESLNLVASGLAQCDWLNGDEILICGSEHHANLLPWQVLAAKHKFKLRIMPMLSNGRLDINAGLEMLSDKTAIVAIAHVSNALGNHYPVKHFTRRANQYNAVSVVDGTQAVPHVKVDIQDLDCDFYVFSGHKMFGPTGTGVLYGRYTLLDKLPAYQVGGEMVQQAQYENATYQKPPLKFEAGTPNIVGVIGLGEAAQFIADNSHQLLQQESLLALALYKQLSAIEDIVLLGDFSTGKSELPIASFTLKDNHVNDLAVLLDQQGIATRHGHHCAMPLMQCLGIDGTLRVSLAAYNTVEEVNRLGDLLRQCINDLKKADTAEFKSNSNTSQSSVSLPLATKIKACHAWDSMFRQIMLAGKNLDILPVESRIDQYYIGGCEADVWLNTSTDDTSQMKVFSAYSPSKIVRGLLAILLERANSLHTAKQQTFDYEAYLVDIGLARFLSESRQNGIAAVIGKIKSG